MKALWFQSGVLRFFNVAVVGQRDKTCGWKHHWSASTVLYDCGTG